MFRSAVKQDMNQSGRKTDTGSFKGMLVTLLEGKDKEIKDLKKRNADNETQLKEYKDKLEVAIERSRNLRKENATLKSKLDDYKSKLSKALEEKFQVSDELKHVNSSLKKSELENSQERQIADMFREEMLAARRKLLEAEMNLEKQKLEMKWFEEQLEPKDELMDKVQCDGQKVQALVQVAAAKEADIEGARNRPPKRTRMATDVTSTINPEMALSALSIPNGSVFSANVEMPAGFTTTFYLPTTCYLVQQKRP